MVKLREEGEGKGQEQGGVMRSKSRIGVDQRAVERCTGREREQWKNVGGRRSEEVRVCSKLCGAEPRGRSTV